VIIGYAYVVGDLLHVGHLLHLQNCKQICDRLIVGVLTDEAAMEKKDRPVMPFDDRIRLVSQLKPVDAAVPQVTYSPWTNLKEIQPDILFECQSHAQRSYPEFDGRTIPMPYYPGRSSTDIKEKIKHGD
jgi:glycerol-3-phosphate cytidylyltransferase